MKSLSKYKEELTEIASRYSYSGVVVDMIVSLLAYSLHENDYNILIQKNESDPSTATRLNNLIGYAMSRMYSTYRGSNPKIVLKVKADLYLHLSKHQLIWSGKGFNVYNLDEIDLIKGQEYMLNCIVATKVESIESTQEMRSMYYLDFNLKDVSEDISLYQSAATTYEEMEFSKVMSDLTDKGIPLQVTSFDYGIRFYFKTSNTDRINVKYKLIYYPYYDKDILESDIDKINSNGLTILDKSIINLHTRDGIGSGVGEKAKMNLLSEGRIRSNTDFLEVFDLYFSDKVLSSNLVIAKDYIWIYYISKSGLEISNQTEFIKYISPLLPCSTENGEALGAKPIKIVKASRYNPGKVFINISLKSSGFIDFNPIYEYLNTKVNKLGILIDSYEIATQLSKILDVTACKVEIDGTNAATQLIQASTSPYVVNGKPHIIVRPSNATKTQHIQLAPNQYIAWDKININIER